MNLKKCIFILDGFWKGDAEMKIITKDLFEASYLLSKGMHLQDVYGDRHTILFQFEGDESLGILKSRYERGRAEANVRTLKKQMTLIKDIMFTKLRERQAAAGS